MSSGGLQAGDRYWSLVKPVWRSISIYDGPTVFLGQFGAARPEVGHLFAAHWCQSEVRNGGLHQFFANSTGVLAPEALAGYRAIGLREWAAILAEAMAFFGSPYPREKGHRHERLAQRESLSREEWDPFHALDDQLLTWLDAEEDRWERAADAYASRFRA
jgi:hypothetical protein